MDLILRCFNLFLLLMYLFHPTVFYLVILLSFSYFCSRQELANTHIWRTVFTTFLFYLSCPILSLSFPPFTSLLRAYRLCLFHPTSVCHDIFRNVFPLSPSRISDLTPTSVLHKFLSFIAIYPFVPAQRPLPYQKHTQIEHDQSAFFRNFNLDRQRWENHAVNHDAERRQVRRLCC